MLYVYPEDGILLTFPISMHSGTFYGLHALEIQIF